MSHEITATDSMAYVGEVPWHGLGTPFSEPLYGHEMLEAISASFTLALRPVLTVLADGSAAKVPDKFAVVIEQGGVPLNIVGDKFRVIQPEHAFSIPDALIDEGFFKGYMTGGTLKGRRIMWSLAEFGETHVRRTNGSVQDDQVKRYLLFAFGNDGTMAGHLVPTDVRVVCNNTLQWALGAKGGGLTIRHSGDVDAKVKEAHRLILNAQKQFDQLGEVYQAMEDRRMSMESFRSFAEHVAMLVGGNTELKSTPQKIERAKADRAAEIRQLVQLFGEGPGNRGRTQWDAYNAVTDWLDHRREPARQAKDERKRAEARMTSTLWGQATQQKAAAIKLLASA